MCVVVCVFNAWVKLFWHLLSSVADHALLSFSFVCVASLGTVLTSAGGVFVSVACTSDLSSTGIFLRKNHQNDTI